MREAYLHRLAYAGISDENDASILSDDLEQPIIERAHEQHIRTKFVAGEHALSMCGLTKETEKSVVGQNMAEGEEEVYSSCCSSCRYILCSCSRRVAGSATEHRQCH